MVVTMPQKNMRPYGNVPSADPLALASEDANGTRELEGAGMLLGFYRIRGPLGTVLVSGNGLAAFRRRKAIRLPDLII